MWTRNYMPIYIYIYIYIYLLNVYTCFIDQIIYCLLNIYFIIIHIGNYIIISVATEIYLTYNK